MLTLFFLSLANADGLEMEGAGDNYLAKIFRAIMELDEAVAADPDVSADPVIDLTSNLVVDKTPGMDKGDLIKPAPMVAPGMDKGNLIKPAPMPGMDKGNMVKPAPPMVAVDPVPPGHGGMVKPAPMEDDCRCPMGRRRLVNPTGYACPVGGKKVPKMQELPCAGGTRTMQCEGPYIECEVDGVRVAACNKEKENCAALMAEDLLEKIDEKVARMNDVATPYMPNPHPNECEDAWDCHGKSVYCWKGYYGAPDFCQYGEGIGSLCKDSSGCGWIGSGNSLRKMTCVHQMHYNPSRRRQTTVYAPNPNPNPSGEYYGTCKDPWA